MSYHMPECLGRWCAVLVVVPFLLTLAYTLLAHPKQCKIVARALIAFSVLFLVYEVLWIAGVLWH